MNELLRLAVWNALLDAARFERYYRTRAEAHRKSYRRLRFFLLFAAVGGLARLLGPFPPAVASPVAEAASVAIVGLVIWEFMADDGKKAMILHAIATECAEYDIRLRSLWMSLNSGEDVDEFAIRTELRLIQDSLLQVTARAGQAHIAEHEQDNQRAMREADRDISNRFATQEGRDG